MMKTKDNKPFVPIYRRLFEEYKQAILSQKFKPGTRIDSINEIQNKYAVSRETAKKVLQDLSDNGLIFKKPGKGSFVVDLGPRKPVWGVIVPFFSAQIEQLLSHLHTEAQKLGRKVEHYLDHNDWQEEIRLVGTLINKRYEAVIVIPTFDERETAAFYRDLKSGGSLVTLLDHTMAGSYFTFVIQSYDLGVKRAVDYLLSRKPKAIAFVKNQIWLGPNMVQELMAETFLTIIENEQQKIKPFIISDVTKLSREWLTENRIGGFFCCDDTDAFRVIGRLKDWKIDIPQRVSVVSYGNTELARYFSPKITSVDPHSAEMAAITANIIKQYLNGKDVAMSQYVLQPELIVRET
ncbi:MAG: substrate-binding domain-containing protein [Calditrichaeota bacterium]|nr:substrate-binding domain-containing protein [Calditrichota bacterium]